MKESENNYDSLVDTIEGIVWQADPQTFRFSFVSKTAESLLGYPLQQWLDNPTFWQDHIHPDDRAEAIEYCKQCTQQMKSHEFDYRMITADGRIVYLHDNVTVIVENNQPLLLRGIMTDITERKNNEEQLLVNERLLSVIYNTVADAIFLVSVEDKNSYKFISVNRTFLEVTGLKANQVIGKYVENVIPANSLNLVLANYQKAIATKSLVQWEETSRYPNGKKSGLISIMPLLDDNGNCDRLVGSVHDITERKNAEEQLALSEQRFKSLVQNGTDLLSILDLAGNYLYVSPTSQKILGYDPLFLTGRNAFDFIHPDDLEFTRHFMKEITIHKSLEVPLFRFRNAIGEWRWIETTLTNLAEDPAIGGIVSNARDVTEKKIADDELTKLSMIARETVNGVIITDEKERIIWINNAFSKLSGYSMEELIGKVPMQFLAGEETDSLVAGYVKEQVERKVPFDFEILNYGKGGKQFYVRVQVQPIFDKDGNIKQYFALQTDITQKKQLEEIVAREKTIRQKEITEAVITAQETERSEIGRELHDNVNQLLAASKLYNEMARVNDKNRNELLSSSSGYIVQAIEEIRKLSKTLITPSITETGLVESIKDLAEDLMHVHPLKIVLAADDFEEDILTEKFKLNIFRIVQEQMNNILKHAHAHIITVSLSQTNEELMIRMSDDGIGFDPSQKKKGVGISNIISRAELYKGEVQIKSSPGNGCSLNITFRKTNLFLG